MSFDTDTALLMGWTMNAFVLVFPLMLCAHSAGEKFTHTNCRHECHSFGAWIGAFWSVSLGWNDYKKTSIISEKQIWVRKYKIVVGCHQISTMNWLLHLEAEMHTTHQLLDGYALASYGETLFFYFLPHGRLYSMVHTFSIWAIHVRMHYL